MLNHIVVMGRLARDPELRYTQTGLPVARFTLAVDRDFKDKDTGERVTDWIDCVAWRSTGEFVSKYFTKGRMAVVEGRLQIQDWMDREGIKRRNAEIVVENAYFGDSKSRMTKVTATGQCPDATMGSSSRPFPSLAMPASRIWTMTVVICRSETRRREK